ncbi:MAG: hypothetical protein LBG04_01175 [Holosporaceae bacterium]|jgi:mevalonate kinase|nr:hypothetical protein [Holosporaceae bacterium]
MKFSTGSKTFLVGEYSVVFGGSAIILITPPSFELRVTNGETSFSGVDPASPAYMFYRSHDFHNISVEFFDPHKGGGGFGASSAQFALLYQLHLRLTLTQFDIDLFLKEYRKFSGINGCAIPSGADSVAQYFNHSIFFDAKTNAVEELNWTFPNLDFAILKTAYKVATHSHLRNIEFFDVSDLQEPIINVKKSFRRNDEELLVRSVQNFFDMLKERNLVIAQNVATIDKLLKIDGIKAAKGCGALGADAILIIFEKQKKNELQHILQRHCAKDSFWRMG